MPTYNFGAFIGETLESLASQVTEGVEVVILDGGSTDDTSDVVNSFLPRFATLRYYRQGERGGIDRDLARTVDLARGDYCWLFCSDDLLRPGALARMLDHIRTGSDMYLCGFTLCTRDMRTLRQQPILRTKANVAFNLAQADDRRAYFEQAETTAAFFSFAGSLVFRKTWWEAGTLDQAFVGSLWAHVARIFARMPEGLRLEYLAGSYLYKRTGNDSFMDKGLAHRYGIAIDGYHRLASTFFPTNSLEARHIRRVIANEFPPWMLLDANLVSDQSKCGQDQPTLDRLAAKAYKDFSVRNWCFRIIYQVTPLAAYRVGRGVYRAVRSLARPSRPT